MYTTDYQMRSHKPDEKSYTGESERYRSLDNKVSLSFNLLGSLSITYDTSFSRSLSHVSPHSVIAPCPALWRSGKST